MSICRNWFQNRSIIGFKTEAELVSKQRQKHTAHAVPPPARRHIFSALGRDCLRRLRRLLLLQIEIPEFKIRGLLAAQTWS